MPQPSVFGRRCHATLVRPPNALGSLPQRLAKALRLGDNGHGPAPAAPLALGRNAAGADLGMVPAKTRTLEGAGANEARGNRSGVAA
jgi:hypothetical protein